MKDENGICLVCANLIRICDVFLFFVSVLFKKCVKFW